MQSDGLHLQAAQGDLHSRGHRPLQKNKIITITKIIIKIIIITTTTTTIIRLILVIILTIMTVMTILIAMMMVIEIKIKE